LLSVLGADVVPVKKEIVRVPVVFGTSEYRAVGCDDKVGKLECIVVGKHFTPPIIEVAATDATVLFVRTVKLISRNAVPASIKDASKDGIAPNADKLLPRISAAVTSVNVAGVLIDKEDPEVMGVGLASCCERGAVFAKINDVVNANSVNVNRAHSAPPFSPPSNAADNIVVKRAPTEGVSSLEAGTSVRPPNTTSV
jgi:hypothetical protein